MALGVREARARYKEFLDGMSERMRLVGMWLELPESPADVTINDFEAIETTALRLLASGLENGLCYRRDRPLSVMIAAGEVELAAAGELELTPQGRSLWIDLAVLFGDAVCRASGGQIEWQLFRGGKRHFAQNHPVVTTGNELTMYAPLREGPRVAGSFLDTPDSSKRATLTWLAQRPVRG